FKSNRKDNSLSLINITYPQGFRTDPIIIMKNILFTLFAILILTSCSKDDDNWIELNENNIVGNWSTGIKGSHKFLNFGDDDKGSFGIYSNADPISFQTFKYKVEDSKIYIYDVFPKGKSPYYLDCKISNNKLKIENGEESGTYEKLEY
ncbi:membrane lipoprotein lipid attachment site-containing protein, partial [Bacteroides xylanisolvens]